MVARRTLLVLGFVGVLAGGGWVYAQQKSASRPANLSAQDYVDIQMLYARYNQGSDFSDTAMWMSIWAELQAWRPSAAAGLTVTPAGSVTTARLRLASARPLKSVLWGV